MGRGGGGSVISIVMMRLSSVWFLLLLLYGDMNGIITSFLSLPFCVLTCVLVCHFVSCVAESVL